eukprot:2979067-Prymnesium_polylepis.1
MCARAAEEEERLQEQNLGRGMRQSDPRCTQSSVWCHGASSVTVERRASHRCDVSRSVVSV